MRALVLTDDDLALLRFTGDLYFSEESPLIHLEREKREPADLKRTYERLLGLGVLEADTFRLSDEAINRIAPVTECDARITHTIMGAAAIRVVTYYLLDEVAVRYERDGDHHVFGRDLDTAEVAAALGEQLIARRAGGDRIEMTLSSIEFAALAALLTIARKRQSRELPLSDVAHAFRLPNREPLVAGSQAATELLRGDLRPGSQGSDQRLHRALRTLMGKGACRQVERALWIHPSLMDLALRGPSDPQHNVVRVDFGDSEWFMRDTALVPADGSLWALAPRRGGFGVQELDATQLRQRLIETVGPFSAARVASPQSLVEHSALAPRAR